MFASYPHSNIQPTTPMQSMDFGRFPAPMVVDDNQFDYPYRNPSPCYPTYQVEPHLTPSALDDAPKMPSISVPPPTVNLSQVTPPLTHTAVIKPQPFAATSNAAPPRSVPLSVKKEMHMATAGTDSAMAGIDTSIAGHVAQLVILLWFSPRTQHLSPTAMSAAAELASTQPFNALSVQASDGFSHFVSHILHLTKVSHSVVLLSLLYIHRMSKCYPPPPMGTEKETFIIGLMLGNKFLDDNTYTNRTWADLSKIPIQTLNSVEHDALQSLGWDLTVKQSDFTAWSKVLTHMIWSIQQTQNHRSPYHSQYAMSPPGAPQTPLTFRQPRARTQSPSEYQTQWMPSAGQIPSPPRQRKRSACDAFSMEAAIAEQHAKSMRVPERRGYVDLPGAPAFNGDRPATGTASSLNRAASMNRAGLRPISQNSRRGSVPGLAHSPLADMPMSAVQYQNQPIDNRHQALVAPVQGQYQLAPPPQSMVFYTCAAESHPGQDGHRRKATLHYQAPPSFYPEQQAQGYQPTNYQISPTAGSTLHQDPISHLAPIPGQYGGSYNIGPPGIPEPADFANAGPPGYQYEQEMQYQQSNNNYAASQYHPSFQNYAPAQPGPIVYGQRRSVGSSDLAQYHHGALPQTRSEWSSPMPGYPSYW